MLSALGSKGDIHPLIALAFVLKSKGAPKVTFLLNDEYKSLIIDHGFNFISTGSQENQDAFTLDKRIWDNRHDVVKVGWKGLIKQSIEEAYQAVENAHKSGEKILVIGLQSIFNGALLAAEAYDIPSIHVTLAPQLISVHSNMAPPAPAKWFLSRKTTDEKIKFLKKIRSKQEKRKFKDTYFKEYNAFRSAHQLAPIEDFTADVIYAHHSLQLCLFPIWFGMPAEDWPSNLTLTGFTLFDGLKKTIPSSVQQFINEQGKPILFSFGTGFFDTQKIFKIACKACDQLKIPALFVGGSFDPKWVQSQRCKHVSYIDFESILPQCRAIVHHGGIGTLSQAIRAGIPQIICPKAFDQFDNADKIYTLGIGSLILKKKLNTKNLSKILSNLLNSQLIIQNNLYLQSMIKGQPAMQQIGTLIENYLNTPKSLRSIHPLKRAIIQQIENKGESKPLDIPLIKYTQISNEQECEAPSLNYGCGHHEVLTMLLHYHKKTITLDYLYQKYPQGLNLIQINTVLKELQLAPKILHCPIDHIPQLKLPCLIQWRYLRFVLLIGIDAEKVILCDPLLEEQSYPIHRFAWHYSGTALECYPLPTNIP